MNIRITKVQKQIEHKLGQGDNSAMVLWLELSIKDLEYRLRYSSPAETQVIQGALRALYDLESLLT